VPTGAEQGDLGQANAYVIGALALAVVAIIVAMVLRKKPVELTD
jgi:hypothetical protein